MSTPKSRAGTVEHKASHSRLSVQVRDGSMRHRVERNGLAAEYPVAVTIGSGNVGQSYAVRIGDLLFQSPISWYSQRGRWDISPGYEQDAAPDFDRRIALECLNCHTGGMRKITDNPKPIPCEQCHPVSGRHFANPAKLPAAQRDALCETCHLQGEARILNPGSSWGDANPSFTTYVLSKSPGVQTVVSQVEQLAESRCVQASEGKLWCGTCHNSHGLKKDVKQVCISCHTTRLSPIHAKRSGDCVSCHMPRRPTPEVAHTVYTDHRIRLRPVNEELVRNGSLTAWREPPSKYRDRNLGLAYIYAGERNRSSDQVQKGFALLLQLADKDAEVFSAMGSVLLQKQRPKEAMAMFTEAVRRQPANPEPLHNLAVATISAHGNEAAIALLERAVAIDPFYERSWLLLAWIYQQLGRPELRTQVIERYLKHVPQNLTFRTALQRR